MANEHWPSHTQPYITYPGSQPQHGSFQAQPSYDGYHSLPPLVYPHQSDTLYRDQSSSPNLTYPGPVFVTHLPSLQYPHPNGVSMRTNYETNQIQPMLQHASQPADSPITPSAPIVGKEENSCSYFWDAPTKQEDINQIYESVEDCCLSREIEVSEIPENATKDTLLNFFEHDRKGGGGPVADIKYNESEHTAIVTFESPESVNTILRRQPCILQGRIMILHVRTSAHEEYMTSLSTLTCASTKEDNSEKKDATSSIHVSGFKDTTSEDNFIYYFENKKRSGGGEILSHQMNRDEGYISITFVQNTDAAEVLQRSHTIDGKTLTVRPYILDDKTVMVNGLTGTISNDTLLNFMEVKAKADVKFVVLSQDKTKAVIEFNHPCDFHEIKMACAKYKLEGVHLIVNQIPKCSSIKISRLPSNISKDALQLYFETNHRSGGGTVERVELDPSAAVCLICFHDHQVVEEVCRRSHVIENTCVEVCPYHICLGKLKVEKMNEHERVSY